MYAVQTKLSIDNTLGITSTFLKKNCQKCIKIVFSNARSSTDQIIMQYAGMPLYSYNYMNLYLNINVHTLT